MHPSHNHFLQYIIFIYCFLCKHLLYVPICNTKVHLRPNEHTPKGQAREFKYFIGRNIYHQAEVAIFKWPKIHLVHKWYTTEKEICTKGEILIKNYIMLLEEKWTWGDTERPGKWNNRNAQCSFFPINQAHKKQTVSHEAVVWIMLQNNSLMHPSAKWLA